MRVAPHNASYATTLTRKRKMILTNCAACRWLRCGQRFWRVCANSPSVRGLPPGLLCPPTPSFWRPGRLPARVLGPCRLQRGSAAAPSPQSAPQPLHNPLVCRYARSLGLAARQNTPALDTAIYYPNSTSYQLQPSFHTSSTEPEPTARARGAGKEFYWATLAFMFVSFRLLVVESI